MSKVIFVQFHKITHLIDVKKNKYKSYKKVYGICFIAYTMKYTFFDIYLVDKSNFYNFSQLLCEKKSV